MKSYSDDDLHWKSNFPVNRDHTRRSTGGMSPRTEWCVHAQRGPVLNSTHYKILSKKTLESIQALTPKTADGSCASTASSSNRSSFSDPNYNNVYAAAGPSTFPAVKRMEDIFNVRSMNLEGIVEGDESAVFSVSEKHVHENLPELTQDQQTPVAQQQPMSTMRALFNGMHIPSLDSISSGGGSLNVSSNSIATADLTRDKTGSRADVEHHQHHHQIHLKSSSLESGLHHLHSLLHHHHSPSDVIDEEESEALLSPGGSDQQRMARSSDTIEYNLYQEEATPAPVAAETAATHMFPAMLLRRRISDRSVAEAVTHAQPQQQQVAEQQPHPPTLSGAQHLETNATEGVPVASSIERTPDIEVAPHKAVSTRCTCIVC